MRPVLLAVSKFPALRGKRSTLLSGPVVVSLTSYPARFPTLALTLKSLIDQTTVPDHLILWLAHGHIAELPSDVLQLREYGLSIRECEDLRSYKKLVPTLELFPDAFIVTADDDVYYPPGWLQELVETCFQSEGAIVGGRAHIAHFGSNGTISPYAEWGFDTRDTWVPPHAGEMFLTGVGGIIYPPGSLHPDATNKSLFMRLCPTTDDVWFFVMALLSNSSRRKAPSQFNVLMWPDSQSSALTTENVIGGENDIQMALAFEHYGLDRVVRLRRVSSAGVIIT